ncbi:MAG: hypothetical protein NTU98_08020 [Bacteroidetes bacterium]|nr:hypothetical protein [Bacteroidota bacterium]
MATYPLATDIAWRVIDQFIEDWKQTPNSWIKEIEIQAEIYSRIKMTFRQMNYDRLEANYAKIVDKNGKIIPVFWSRIALEPPIKYVFEDNNIYVFRPDIVIWDYDFEKNDPPDSKENGGNFPVQLAIEIKTNYQSEIKEDDIDDIKKLKSLLKSELEGNCNKYQTAEYGAWLNFHYLDGNNIKPKSVDKKKRIWRYEIYSKNVNPSLKQKLQYRTIPL